MWDKYKDMELKMQRCEGLAGLPVLNSGTDKPSCNITDDIFRDGRLETLDSNPQDRDPKMDSDLLKINISEWWSV